MRVLKVRVSPKIKELTTIDFNSINKVLLSANFTPGNYFTKMKKWLIIFVVLCLQPFSNLKAQKEDIRPQIWNNLYVGWNISDHVVLRSAVAYNVLLSNEAPWNEFTFSVSGVYKFHRFMEASAGLYGAAAQQSEKLRSYEYRPYAGFRIFTNDTKRWNVTNLSRFEIRKLRYSDRTSDLAYRFRNRTYGVVSLLRSTMVEDKNLYLFGYFEAFYNFGQEVRERFFNQFKYKIGFGYRLSYSWRFDIGVIYQDATNNIVGPVQLPVIINTNYVLEWGILYVIPPKKKD